MLLVVQYEVATSVSLPPWPNFIFGGLFGGPGTDWGSLLVDLGSLSGVSFGSWEKGCRQQLKTSKTAPHCSARPVLLKRLPPSVLAVPRDLRLFDKITFQKTHPSAVPGPFSANMLAKRGL